MAIKDADYPKMKVWILKCTVMFCRLFISACCCAQSPPMSHVTPRPVST